MYADALKEATKNLVMYSLLFIISYSWQRQESTLSKITSGMGAAFLLTNGASWFAYIAAGQVLK